MTISGQVRSRWAACGDTGRQGTRAFAVALALLACAMASLGKPASAASAASTDAPATIAVRDFAPGVVEALARSLYARDLAAARGTDILQAQLSEADVQSLRGYIVTGPDDAPVVVFVGDVNGEKRAFHEIRPWAVPSEQLRRVDARPLTAEEAAYHAARTLALAALEHPCSNRYNTVVLPAPDADGLLVYALAATTDPKRIPLGGHYRFTTSADGTTLVRSERLSNSCMALDMSAIPEGATVKYMLASHAVSRAPNEVHMLISLQQRLGLYLVVPGVGAWKVDGATAVTAPMPGAAPP